LEHTYLKKYEKKERQIKIKISLKIITEKTKNFSLSENSAVPLNGNQTSPVFASLLYLMPDNIL
jgi:hypothetical protein